MLTETSTQRGEKLDRALSGTHHPKSRLGKPRAHPRFTRTLGNSLGLSIVLTEPTPRGSQSIVFDNITFASLPLKLSKAKLAPSPQRFGEVKVMCDGPPQAPEVSYQHIPQRSRRCR